MRLLKRGICIDLPAGAAFSPLSLAPAVWIDPSDLTTMFQTGSRASPGTAVAADGDPVGLILDKSGNQRDLTQATTTKRPLFRTSGGLCWMEFDGVDDSLKVAYTQPQPLDRISAIRQIAWTAGHYLFGGGSAFAGVLEQSSASPILSLYDGSATANNSGAAVGSDAVVTERHNGASGRLAVNNGAYTTGSSGTTAGGGLTIGGDLNSGSASNIRCYGVMQFGSSLADPDIAKVRTYLGNKCGLSL